MFVINDEVLNSSHYSMSEWLLTTRPGLFGLVGGGANPTGLALIMILFVMSLCSMPFVRRGGSFEVKLQLNFSALKISMLSSFKVRFGEQIWLRVITKKI